MPTSKLFFLTFFIPISLAFNLTSSVSEIYGEAIYTENVDSNYPTVLVYQQDFIYVAGTFKNISDSPSDNSIYVTVTNSNNGSIHSFTTYANTSAEVLTSACIGNSGSRIYLAGLTTTTSENSTQGFVTSQSLDNLLESEPETLTKFGGNTCIVESHTIEFSAIGLVSVGVVSNCTGDFDGIPFTEPSLFIRVSTNISLSPIINTLYPIGYLPADISRQVRSFSSVFEGTAIFITVPIAQGNTVPNVSLHQQGL